MIYNTRINAYESLLINYEHYRTGSQYYTSDAFKKIKEAQLETAKEAKDSKETESNNNMFKGLSDQELIDLAFGVQEHSKPNEVKALNTTPDANSDDLPEFLKGVK